MKPSPAPRPDAHKARRNDLRQVQRFHRLLARHPRSGLVLSALAVLAGCAVVLGWVGDSPQRPSAGFRTWVGAALWWCVAAYVGALSLRGWRRRRHGD